MFRVAHFDIGKSNRYVGLSENFAVAEVSKVFTGVEIGVFDFK